MPVLPALAELYFADIEDIEVVLEGWVHLDAGSIDDADWEPITCP